MSFKNWQARLRGEKVTTYLQPQHDDEGYYRKPITEMKQNAAGHNNGQRRIIGWEAVAYFLDGDSLYGVIGNRDMRPDEVTDEQLWSYASKYPVSEEWFRIVENGGAWPDLTVMQKVIAEGGKAVPNDMSAKSTVTTADLEKIAARDFIPAANREVAKTDNQFPPEEIVLPVKQHATAIANAIGVAKATVIADDVTAAQALGIKNRLAELRLAADKAGKAEYQPLYKEYIAIRDQWTPMVKEAADAEDALNRRYLTFRDQQKKAAEKAAAEEAAAQAAIDEANERAAQRAIARGEPEAAPVVEPAPAPTPAPAPVQATYRAPGQRTVQEVEKWHFDAVEDWSKLIEFAKDQPEIRQAMENMAKAMVKAGRDVPGVKRHWGLV